MIQVNNLQNNKNIEKIAQFSCYECFRELSRSPVT